MNDHPRHGPVVRWAMLFQEPYASTSMRVEADQHLLSYLNDHPTWAHAWKAGSLHAIGQSLPDDDPWRYLTARHRAAVLGNPPVDAPGVWIADRTFGSVADVQDIYPPYAPDPNYDPAYLALAEGLDADTAVLVALAASLPGPANSARDSLAALIAAVADIEKDNFERFATAARWLAWRRRCYAGFDDLWVSTAMLAWIKFADDWTGGDPQVEGHFVDIETNAIPNGSWQTWHEMRETGNH